MRNLAEQYRSVLHAEHALVQTDVDYEENERFLVTQLEELKPEWLEYRTKVDRTAGGDAEVISAFEERNNKMNTLLEQLFASQVVLGRVEVE